MTDGKKPDASPGRWLVRHQGGITAGFAAVLLICALGAPLVLDFGLSDIPMPAAVDSDGARMVMLFFLYAYAVIAFALALKLVETAHVARWMRTSGVIVQSQPGFRTIHRARRMPEQRRIADIVFEFKVPDGAGRDKLVRGKRIDISETMAEEDVPAALQRFPVGKPVFVYYDPQDPEAAVLDPGAEDRRKTVVGLFWLAVVFAGLAFPIMVLTTGVDALAAALEGRGHLALAAVFGLFGLVMLVLFRGLLRDSRRVQGWPVTEGEVVLTELVPYMTELRKTTRRGRRSRSRLPGANEGLADAPGYSGRGEMYLPVVEYAYTVGVQRHVSRNIRLNTQTGMDRASAEAVLARYSRGSKVAVHYDPDDPSRAALESGLGMGWSLLFVGLACGAAAIAVAVLGNG